MEKLKLQELEDRIKSAFTESERIVQLYNDLTDDECLFYLLKTDVNKYEYDCNLLKRLWAKKVIFPIPQFREAYKGVPCFGNLIGYYIFKGSANLVTYNRGGWCELCQLDIRGKGTTKFNHFKETHPEYKFHREHRNNDATWTYVCDLCGMTVSGVYQVVAHYDKYHSGNKTEKSLS